MVKEQHGSIYELDGVPPLGTSIITGLQHVFAMFVGNVTPLLIVGGALNGAIEKGLINATPVDVAFLVQCCLFTSGLTSLLQCYPLGIFGARLPIIMGTSFAFVSVGISVAGKYGMPGVLGAVIVATIVQVIIAFIIKPILKYFPPVIAGCLVLMIGINLIPVGMQYFGGGAWRINNANPAIAASFADPKQLTVAVIVFLVVAILSIFGKGFWRVSAILVGLVIGYLIALPLGLVTKLGAVSTAKAFSVPLPFQYGVEFHADAIITMIIICIVCAVETFGNICAITERGLGRRPKHVEIRGGMLADAVGSLLAGVFNVLPNTAFGQNIGIIAMTRVVNRFAVATGGIFLIIAGFFPKLSAVVVSIPDAVLGGAMVVLFAMIFTSGLTMVSKHGMTNRITLITAISIGLGMGIKSVPQMFAHMPEWTKLVFESGIVMTVLVAFILNIIMPKGKEDHVIGEEIL